MRIVAIVWLCRQTGGVKLEKPYIYKHPNIGLFLSVQMGAVFCRKCSTYRREPDRLKPPSEIPIH